MSHEKVTCRGGYTPWGGNLGWIIPMGDNIPWGVIRERIEILCPDQAYQIWIVITLSRLFETLKKFCVYKPRYVFNNSLKTSTDFLVG